MKIRSVEIQSADLSRTLQFYTKILGLEALAVSDEQLIFSIGRSQLIFTKAETGYPYYHFAIEVPNNQLDDVADQLDKCVMWIKQADGGLFADFKAWNARSIYCYDNNHNILEFIARFDNATYNEKSYEDRCVVCISEIGIVAPDVSCLASEIMESTGCTTFSKQPPENDFIALGDDEGLMILSSDKRCWFPTKYPAKHFPTSVGIEMDGLVVALSYP